MCTALLPPNPLPAFVDVIVGIIMEYNWAELCVYVGSRLMPSIPILVCLHIPGCLDRVALHNGGGVGWGEVMNGGFGLLLDGTADAARRASSMLFWDVNNGYVWSAHATSRVRCNGISLIML